MGFLGFFFNLFCLAGVSSFLLPFFNDFFFLGGGGGGGGGGIGGWSFVSFFQPRLRADL